MKYDAVSFVPDRPFQVKEGRAEFEDDNYCLKFDQAITLHLKQSYLDNLWGNLPAEQRPMRRWYFYTVHLNCLYLFLDSIVMRELKIAYFSIQEVTTQNADVISKGGMSISPLSNRPPIGHSHPQVLTIPKEVLELVNHSFRTIISEFERLYVLSETTKSLASYKSAAFTTSFVLCWFLLERFVESRWDSFLETENHQLDNGMKRINADRKKTLKDSRSYPVSVKLQILELAGKLSFGQFSDLDLLRAKRNDIVHPPKGTKENVPILGDPENCVKAFQLLQQFLESDFDLSLPLNKGALRVIVWVNLRHFRSLAACR